MTRAVILAAGMGTRMGEIGQDTPKCLLNVEGRPLLAHLHEALTGAGVRDIIVVVGHKGLHIRRWLAAHFPATAVVRNRDFERTTSSASLRVAASRLAGEDFLVLNGDVLHLPETIRRMLAHPASNAVLVDPGADHDHDEYRVICDANGFVTGYHLGAPEEISVGRSAQLLKVGTDDAAAFLDEVSRLADHHDGTGFPLDAYPVLIAGAGLRPVYTAGIGWWEIDTPEDLRRCRRQKAKDSRREAERLARRPEPGTVDLLAAHGHQLLVTVLEESAAAGVPLVLGWGTLLGAVRGSDFLPGDSDLDLLVLPGGADRLGILRDRLLARGMRIRFDLPHKLSVVHPEHDGLWVDIDVVFDRGTHLDVINRGLPDRTLHYRFTRSVFDGPATTLRLRDLPVSGPADPEAFLTQVYGDWKTPAGKVNFLFGPLNVVVELHLARP